MSKKKKSKGKVKRPHTLPKDYLVAVADRIVKTNPTTEIVNNTLEGVYSVAYTKGYSRRMSDEKLFRDRRTSHFEDDWKKELTVIDDLIHPLKIKSTNQKNK
jgi:hypothetical protein